MTDLLESIDARGVATIMLNRPERRNAFDEALVSQLTIALRRLDADKDVRIIVLCGAGKCFCAGADIGWMKRAASRTFEENLSDAIALADLMRALDLLSKPTIALAHGASYGGGVGLIACCDIAIAAVEATFCLSEVKIGVIPAVIGPYLVRSVGARQARRLVLTAEVISAEQALTIGLVHEVVKEDEIRQARDRVINLLLAGAPGAQAESKRLVAVCRERAMDDELSVETARLIAKARSSREGEEGLSAFLNKRPPAWLKDANA